MLIQSQSLSHLPEELIIEILSRLPVPTLLSYKSVSKPWQTLISTNPNFIKFHLSHSSPQLLLTSSSSTTLSSLHLFSMSSSSNISSRTAVRSVNLSFPHQDEFTVVGSCNGVICLSEFKTFVSLWNPAIRDYFMLPYDPIDPGYYKCHKERRRVTVFGLGYVRGRDEFKVVKLRHSVYPGPLIHKTLQLCDAKVWNSNTNSWRSVKVEDSRMFRNPNDEVLHLDGVLYWLNTDCGSSDDEKTSIVWFDLVREEFGTISYPESILGKHYELKLIEFDGCLCFTRRVSVSRIHVWLLKEGLWTKLFEFVLDDALSFHELGIGSFALEPIAFRKNGELLVKFGEKDVLLYEPKQKTFGRWTIEGVHNWFRSFTYVESLISVAAMRGCNGVKKEKESWSNFGVMNAAAKAQSKEKCYSRNVQSWLSLCSDNP